MPDDADLVEETMNWLADPALARRVLVENPGRLYWPEKFQYADHPGEKQGVLGTTREGRV